MNASAILVAMQHHQLWCTATYMETYLHKMTHTYVHQDSLCMKQTFFNESNWNLGRLLLNKAFVNLRCRETWCHTVHAHKSLGVINNFSMQLSASIYVQLTRLKFLETIRYIVQNTQQWQWCEFPLLTFLLYHINFIINSQINFAWYLNPLLY